MTKSFSTLRRVVKNIMNVFLVFSVAFSLEGIEIFALQ